MKDLLLATHTLAPLDSVIVKIPTVLTPREAGDGHPRSSKGHAAPALLGYLTYKKTHPPRTIP